MYLVALLLIAGFLRLPVMQSHKYGALNPRSVQDDDVRNNPESSPTNIPRDKADDKENGSSLTANNQETGTSDENCAAKGSDPWYTSPEWWLAIIGFPTIFFLGWQAVETKNAARAANRNIEATMNERRARIEIIASGLAATSVGPGGSCIVSVSLKNIGPTVGIIRGVSVSMVESSKEVTANYRECSPLGLTGTVPPDSETSRVMISQKIVGQSAIHFYGFAMYEDVYGRAHRVQVHVKWGGNGVWIITGKPSDNSDLGEKQPHKSWMQRLTELVDKEPPWISPN
jgi:hypothetical protein